MSKNKNLIKLDKTDKKILYYLDINSREPLTLLAKKARISPQALEYRIKKLRESGIIKNYLTFLDAGKLGLMVWNVYLEMSNTKEEDEKRILNFLKNHKKTWWVASCSGKWDIIYSVCVKDVVELYEVVNFINNKYSKFIRNSSICAHVKIEIISRGFFLNKPGKNIPWYKNKNKIELDKKDIKILKAISKNSRMPVSEISKKVNLTGRTIAYRIKKLKESGIITRFRLDLDVNKIGYSFYKVIIHTKNFTEEKNQKLKNYAINEGNIFHYEQKIGPWMLEMELNAESYEEADKQMQKMKMAHSDFINKYELLLIKKEIKSELDLTKFI